MERNYKLYVHIVPNGKKYYGITKCSVKRRWRGGEGYKTQLFYRAIEKYGWDNIEHIVLYNDLSEEEALELEQRFIQWYSTNNPNYGYNITAGGEGSTGIGRPGDKNPMYGKTGEKNPASKKVIRLDTGEIFESITQAAKSVNGKPRSLSGALCRGSKFQGIAFKFYDDYLKTGEVMRDLKIGANSPCCRKVIRLDTGEVFNSVRQAAESINGNKDSLSSKISKGCSYKGIYFKYYEDYLESGNYVEQPKDNRQKVIRIDTGEVFNSIKDAAESINSNHKSLGIALKRGTKYKGIEFRYYE